MRQTLPRSVPCWNQIKTTEQEKSPCTGKPVQRLFARFQATCVSVQTQAAVVEAASLDAASETAASLDAASEEADSVSASLEAASEEAASEEAATEEDTASEVEAAAVEEAEPPQAVMPAARARATTATATFLSFISLISLFLKKYLHRGPCVRGLSARQYSSLFYKKIKRILGKDCNISGESTLLL